MKQRFHELLESTRPSDKLGRWFNLAMGGLIAANVVAVVVETVEHIGYHWSLELYLFEAISVLVFTIEYLTRLWACTVDKRYRHPVFGRIRFAFTFFALVDLLAILPFFLPLVMVFDLRVLRILRLIRLFRIFKLGRYSNAVRVFGEVFRIRRAELLITLFVVSMLLVLSSSLMYFVEHEAQPEAFSSIPVAMWWGVATLTTVGYGDVYPITLWGKFLGAIIAVLGIGLFAVPAGILASGFGSAINRAQAKRCPHCGRDVE